jgi:hypothetical protein
METKKPLAGLWSLFGFLGSTSLLAVLGAGFPFGFAGGFAALTRKVQSVCDLLGAFLGVRLPDDCFKTVRETM